MKRILVVLSLLTMIFMVSCNNDRVVKTPEVNITTAVNPADGLDFKLVGALLQKGTIKDAEGLEKELNKPDGINNLDLNEDGKVDYINVSENNGGDVKNVKSFDLTTGDKDNTTFIGSVEVEKVGDTYNINMSGSEAIYGQNANYQSHVTAGDMLFYAWLFSPRPLYYHNPYYMGYYPSYYGGPRVAVSHSVYTTRTASQRTSVSKTVTTSKTKPKSKIASANKGKISKSTRTSINNNKKAQKSFQARNKNKSKKSGGFTKGKTVTIKSKSTISKPSWGSSRSSSRSFSGGRRSDIRTKENIQDFNFGLPMVRNFHAKTYKYKLEYVKKENLPTTKQYGFIAQDVEKMYPEFVITDANGLKSIDYEMLIPVLTQSIVDLANISKQQQAEIEELKQLTANK